ncbi:MAG: MerR family transcriptional regulator [Anaerolineae bacterium]|nr:helix-turn-helix domain-containing protein [Anaerolineae bacterium]MDW8098268.1 MerR family transcriptional regulator [Anaerolineae bacterium]
MSEQNLRRPAEVAARLGISTSTLRRWSQRFSEFLSSDAGGPDSAADADGIHRRYTDEDLTTLLMIKGLLAEGFTYQQVERRLAALKRGDREDERALSVVTAGGSVTALSPAISILADTLHTVADSQQAILNAQQANRELMGVVVQDNFSIKEENAKLRDRMLELEREMAEIRRREEVHRERMESRIQAIESTLGHIAEQLATLQEQAQASQRRGRGLLGWLVNR